jgi:hypothetical protein
MFFYIVMIILRFETMNGLICSINVEIICFVLKINENE